MSKIFLGLGSNIDPREFYLDSAIFFLDLFGIDKIKESTRIETDPVGFLDQSKFINSVIEAETILTPQLLLKACLLVEKILGRVRTQKNGPRTIDIDVLLYDDEIHDQDELIIPHPRMHQRQFVLSPLVELAPQLQHPLLKQSFAEILHDVVRSSHDPSRNPI